MDVTVDRLEIAVVLMELMGVVPRDVVALAPG